MLVAVLFMMLFPVRVSKKTGDVSGRTEAAGLAEDGVSAWISGRRRTSTQQT